MPSAVNKTLEMGERNNCDSILGDKAEHKRHVFFLELANLRTGSVVFDLFSEQHARMPQDISLLKPTI